MPRVCKSCGENSPRKGKRLCDQCSALCTLCRLAPHTATHHYCRECKARQARNSRIVNPPTPEQRRRLSAASYAAVYLSRGKIERKPCEIEECGIEPTFAFQPNLSKPLEITWCCKRHLRLMRKKDV